MYDRHFHTVCQLPGIARVNQYLIYLYLIVYLTIEFSFLFANHG